MAHDSRSTLSRRRVLQSATLVGLGAALARVPLVAGERARNEQARGPSPITRAIPATGEPLPVVGLGTNAYGTSVAAELAARRSVLERLPELGGKVIDTARAYGESELVLGRLIEELGIRRQLFLATKTPLSGDLSRPDGLLEESLRRLRTDVIDLMQIHNLHGLQVLLPALKRWKERGRIRYAGVTTSSDEQYPQLLEVMRREPLDFVQVDYSIANRGAADQILPLALERGQAVLVNMPFGGRRSGNLFPRLAGRALPAWAAEFGAGSWAELLLKYCISHPAVTCVVPGTTKVANLETNLRAAHGRLPDAQARARIERFWDRTFPA